MLMGLYALLYSLILRGSLSVLIEMYVYMLFIRKKKNAHKDKGKRLANELH